MPAALWHAPTADSPVHGAVSVPGSKSLANRALVLAALSEGGSTITGLPLAARDITLMVGALRALGCGIAAADESPAGAAVRVQPGPVTAPAQIDCGLAGTVMRFVPPMAALAEGPVCFDGDPRARERPMSGVIDALRSLGVRIDDGGRAALPFTVLGGGRVAGGPVSIDASGSSQFVTALLLSGARFSNGVEIHHRGGPFPSLPHIEMTCRMLREHGVVVDTDTAERGNACWSVQPGRITALDRAVEPDLSNALPLAAAALVTGGSVLIRDWPAESLQPAEGVVDLLHSLGARTEPTAAGMLVRGTGRVRGISADLRDLGELVPTVAAVCALADSPSRLVGIGHISGHETDRIAALAAQINSLGGDVTADEDGLLIRPRPMHGGTWATYRDHRMATAGAIVGLMVPGLDIEDIATTAKTFAQFPTVWRNLVGPTAATPAGTGG